VQKESNKRQYWLFFLLEEISNKFSVKAWDGKGEVEEPHGAHLQEISH